MAIPLRVFITQGNTQDINLYGLQDIDTLVFWNVAVASANLIDQNGNLTEVSTTLSYLGDLGNYRGTITTDFNLPVGGGYRLAVDAQDGGAKFHIELPAEVIIRSQ